jgi:hypothetical protein
MHKSDECLQKGSKNVLKFCTKAFGPDLHPSNCTRLLKTHYQSYHAKKSSIVSTLCQNDDQQLLFTCIAKLE